MMINVILQLCAAFFGTISFAILFEVKKKYYLYCGLIGAIGWATYLIITHFWHAPMTATFIATLSLIYMSREVSYGLHSPVSIFLITGIFCLVPGIGIYDFTYNFFVGNSQKTAAIGVKVLKVCIAIALGIAAGYELPPKFFYFQRRNQRRHR